MGKATENPNTETRPSPQPNHQMDADDDDENVKQLKECSSLYLSLQDCLVESNRDWKSCQKQNDEKGIGEWTGRTVEKSREASSN